MATLAWKDAWTLHIPHLDAQHQHLVELVSHLQDALHSRRETEDLCGILQALIAHAEAHFAQEERLMLEHGYAGYRRHRRVHQNLLDQILGFHEDLRQGHPICAATLMSLLHDWVTHHLEGEDARLAPLMAGAGSQQPAAP